jgi:hypothetical protein
MKKLKFMDENKLLDYRSKWLRKYFLRYLHFACTAMAAVYIVDGVCIKSKILCVLCAQGRGVFLLCENIHITCFYVSTVNYHVVVSLCCTLHVPKSQCMQQLIYNYFLPNASIAMEVQFLAL